LPHEIKKASAVQKLVDNLIYWIFKRLTGNSL